MKLSQRMTAKFSQASFDALLVATLFSFAAAPNVTSGQECSSAFGRVQSSSNDILRIVTVKFVRDRACSPEIPEGTSMEFVLTGETILQSSEGGGYLPVTDIPQYRMASVQFERRGAHSVATYVQFSDKIPPPLPPEQIAEARQYYERGNEAAAQGGFDDSAKWYTKAAELGNANAQERLGWQYANGKGVDGDYGQAMFWWTRAAQQGNADAERELNDLRGRLAKNLTEHPVWPTISSGATPPNCKIGQSLYSTREGDVCVPGPSSFEIVTCIRAHVAGGLAGCQTGWLIGRGFHGPYIRLRR